MAWRGADAAWLTRGGSVDRQPVFSADGTRVPVVDHLAHRHGPSAAGRGRGVTPCAATGAGGRRAERVEPLSQRLPVDELHHDEVGGASSRPRSWLWLFSVELQGLHEPRLSGRAEHLEFQGAGLVAAQLDVVGLAHRDWQLGRLHHRL
jgi:hypothetical protein